MQTFDDGQCSAVAVVSLWGQRGSEVFLSFEPSTRVQEIDRMFSCLTTYPVHHTSIAMPTCIRAGGLTILGVRPMHESRSSHCEG